jgi:phosphonate transport system substrate-binding protein
MVHHHSLHRIASLVAVVVVLAGCGAFQAAPTPTPAPTATVAAKNIVLADISDNPAKRIAAFQPLADYLGANLGKFGYGGGVVKIADDFDTMIKWIKAGEVDLYFDSPFPATVLADRAGAQPILRRWRDGVSEYHSVLFARADSGIKSIEDLKGRMIAFDEPYSTSGYALPLAYLVDKGLKLVEKSSPDATVAKDEVGYVFSTNDENTIQWVVSGKVAAGTTDNLNYANIPDENRSAMTIVAETKAAPRQVATVRPGMEPAMVEAIKALLVGLDKTPEGKDILKTFQKTDKFDEFPGGVEVALAPIRDAYAVTQKQTR